MHWVSKGGLWSLSSSHVFSTCPVKGSESGGYCIQEKVTWPISISIATGLMQLCDGSVSLALISLFPKLFERLLLYPVLAFVHEPLAEWAWGDTWTRTSRNPTIAAYWLRSCDTLCSQITPQPPRCQGATSQILPGSLLILWLHSISGTWFSQLQMGLLWGEISWICVGNPKQCGIY